MTALLIGLAVWVVATAACLPLTLYVQHRRWERRQEPRGAQILQFKPRGRTQ